METIKNFIVMGFTALAAYFHPIQDILIAVLAVLASNFVFGLVAGILAGKESFSFKKAFLCFIEAFIFFGFIAFVFFIGDKVNNRDGASQCITAITYALLYFYGVNILRNLKLLLPDNKVISFIYYMVSIEFIDKIPYLKNFLNISHNETKQ